MPQPKKNTGTGKKPAAEKTPARKTTGKKRITFNLEAEPGREVYVAGTFNDWSDVANRLKDKDGSGLYSAILLIAPGIYEYKFIIDGTWCVDPACAEWVQNDCGTLNSLLRV